VGVKRIDWTFIHRTMLARERLAPTH
jgi:hypothetical protein